jgi:acetylornithine/succinyldiaminopimelate/putrescine aminotransferase
MPLDALREIRTFGPHGRTIGLPDDVIARFAERDASLVRAVDDAMVQHRRFRVEMPEILELDEPGQVQVIQRGFVNFYPETSVNPYVALAARGPGGYGMLGLGHAPGAILEAMARPQVMANIMTPSLSQLRLVRALKREIGRRRPEGCPFSRFVCLNSGSESVTLAARISDINAKLQTDPDGPHAGKKIKIFALKGAFHGRTGRPAQFSDSSRRCYQEHLATFRGRDNLLTAAPNDIDGLKAIYARAERENWFIEALFIEPVMGEGNPGLAITREFYDVARELSRAHGSLFLVDSIQAGLRAHGCLSIVDYPGFEDAEPPDAETYSKALNAGQYPLSVLALTDRSVGLYRTGVYGNTMTTNPRAMEVACAVLDAMTPELRRNIGERGVELVDKLKALAGELDGAIVRVQGTGLLLSCELNPGYKAYGRDSVEEYMRIHGIGVIHGGENSLRYTPHFAITSEEVDLIVDATRDALVHGPALRESAAVERGA